MIIRSFRVKSRHTICSSGLVPGTALPLHAIEATWLLI